MTLDVDNHDPSPRHRRSQNAPSQMSSVFRRQASTRDDGEGWAVLLRRHRFLLTMLALLAFLCTVYLYFAITLGASENCSGMNDTEKALCQLKQTKPSFKLRGKLRFF